MICARPLLAAALAALTLSPLSAGETEGLRVLRRFGTVPAFGITHACVIEADPAFYKFSVVSAEKAAGKPRLALPDLRRLLPEPALIVNAGFFRLDNGAPIGELVEDGERAPRLVYAPGKNLDRIFVARYDDSVDVLAGREKLTDTELFWTRSAVTGKSAWPGHASLASRTALCVTRGGKVLLAAVHPVRTVEELFEFMAAEGCDPERTVNLDGGGSTQMSYDGRGERWSLGWEREGNGVPDCHLRADNRDRRCYRPVANFIVVEPRRRPFFTEP
ncbi:MAG: phosphodiester glycosidase family protein [Elusimicrobiales bacterium]